MRILKGFLFLVLTIFSFSGILASVKMLSYLKPENQWQLHVMYLTASFLIVGCCVGFIYFAARFIGWLADSSSQFMHERSPRMRGYK